MATKRKTPRSNNNALKKKVKGFSTAHTLDSKINPQNYFEHMKVSFWGSLNLILYGFGGLVHAIAPEIKCLQFWTSSGVIKAYRSMEMSNRHDSEIKKIFSSKRLKYIEKSRGK